MSESSQPVLGSRKGIPASVLAGFFEPIPDKTLIHITQDWVDEAMRGSRPVDLLDPGIRQPEAGFMARYFSTSGTTGEAKLIGITASHHSRCVYSRPNRSWVGLLEAPRFLLVYDFTAEALYRSACASLVAGGTVIFGTPTFEWMLASKANVTWMLPAELAPIVQSLPAEGTRPAPIRLVTGGSHISAALRRDLSRVAADVVDLYGSNESGEIAWRRADGAFTPYPDVEVAIIDRTGRPAPPGEAGAIAVRTDTLVAGYLGDRAEGQQNFSNGWFVTTDLGVLESDGTLRVLGRRDDLLSLSGRKVSPYPIEEAIREALGGVEVVCVDHADPGSLMTILGVAVRMPQGTDADTFRARAADLSFPDYPGPIRYRLVDSFPVTAAGKPDRRAIRRLFNTPD